MVQKVASVERSEGHNIRRVLKCDVVPTKVGREYPKCKILA